MTARDLLAAATRRPWGMDEQKHPELAPFTPDEHGDPQLDWSEEVAAVVSGRADAALIVAAVNEYEALLDIADAARDYRAATVATRDESGAIVCDFTLQVEPRKRLDAGLDRLDALRSAT